MKLELKSISQACNLSSAIYDPIEPNIFDKVFTAGNVSVGYNIDVDRNVIFSFAGTQTLIDIKRDLELTEYEHPQLGIIVSGFWEGMDDVWLELEPLLQDVNSISINGHSLGSSHAIYLAGLCFFNNYKVLSLYLFAPPKSSYSHLVEILEWNIPYLRAFRNGNDPIPHFPLGDWEQYDLINLNAHPNTFFRFPLQYHRINLYIKGVSKLKRLNYKSWHRSILNKIIKFFI